MILELIEVAGLLVLLIVLLPLLSIILLVGAALRWEDKPADFYNNINDNDEDEDNIYFNKDEGINNDK